MLNRFKKKIVKNKEKSIFPKKPAVLVDENLPYICLTGMGRSGTHFFAKLFNESDKVSGYHMDRIGNPVADSFYQYAKWYGLPVDIQPFINARKYLAKKEMSRNSVLLESNPYLTLHLKELNRHLDCKTLIVYREPRKVIESHFNKGWFHNFNPIFDPKIYKAPGYHYDLEKPHYFFGRFFPNNKEDFNKWKKYSVVGKIAWNWQAVYKQILNDIKGLSNVKLLRTDEVNYEVYEEVSSFLNLKPVEEHVFQKIVKQKPGKGIYKRIPEWNLKECDEFDSLIIPTLDILENHELRQR